MVVTYSTCRLRASAIGVATGGMGQLPPPTVSRPGPMRLSQIRWEFFGRGGGGGKDNLHENICQKLHPDKLKMQQKAFGARTHWGSLSAPPDSLATMRRITCKGEGREEKEGEVKER